MDSVRPEEPSEMVTVSADDGNRDITEGELGPIGSHIDSWSWNRKVMPLTIDEHTGKSYPLPLHALSWKGRVPPTVGED